MCNDQVVFLYRITRIETGKTYIGMTTKPTIRWWTHRWMAGKSSSLIHKALAKYGEDSFVFEIIGCSRNWQDGAETERQLIMQYGSYVLDGGYNLTKGGEGVLGNIFSDESRERIGRSRRGKPGRPIPESEKQVHRDHTLRMYAEHPEYRNELSKRALESRIRNGNLITGRTNSEETKRKMSEAAKKRWSSIAAEDRTTLLKGSWTDEERRNRAKKGAQTRMASGQGIAGLLRMTKEDRSNAMKKAWITRKAKLSQQHF